MSSKVVAKTRYRSDREPPWFLEQVSSAPGECRVFRGVVCWAIAIIFLSLDAQAATLRVDFNQGSSTQTGWVSIGSGDSALGDSWSKSFPGGISMDVDAAGAVSLDTRDRGGNNGGGSENTMWRDFLFANGSDRSNEGLDFRFAGLIPNSVYPITIWSYDISSQNTRRSTWNGIPYNFDGRNPVPRSLTDYAVTLEIETDAAGTATIEARTGSPPGPTHNVFVNGLEIGDPVQLTTAPVDITLSGSVAYKVDPLGTTVGTLGTIDAEPGDTFAYALAAGAGDDDSQFFTVDGDRLITRQSLDGLLDGQALSVRIRTTDSDGEFFEKPITITVLADPDSLLPLRINEILADGRNAHLDGDGEPSDWVEIHNPNNRPIDLSGYTLTDDPDRLTKWTFPVISIPAMGYVVIFASAPEEGGARIDDYRDARGNFHANFRLDAGGEFLAIVRPGGRGIEASFSPGYPGQFEDVSYGYGDGEQLRFFHTPTPGAANGGGADGVVRDTMFSIDRGFYDSPFTVAIATQTPESNIRYTLDGSKPTPTRGLLYAGEISIDTTTTLRAIAYRDGWIPTNVDTQTYVFVDDVAKQPARPAGWPRTWGTNSEVNNNDGAGTGTVPADYEMDPRVVNSTLSGYSVREALLDIPSVSIVMGRDDFIAPGSGVYAIPQSRIEKECSMEYLLPDGSRGFQEDCKIEVHGNSSRRPWRMQKHSLRVTFSSEFGPAKLRYSLFPESPIDEFNKLVLRACFTDSWGLVSWAGSRYRPNDSQYIRDVWMKESLRAMGQPSSYGNYVHLYVNGLYFGLHNLTERLEDDFFQAHLGGRKEDWEINEDLSAPGRRWNQMMAIDVSSESEYARIQEYVDLENFADYMILHFYADAEDWPHHNGYAAANSASGDGRFRFFVWDQEIVLDKFTWNRYGGSRGAGALFQKLRANPEFLALFADRVRKHLYNGGALSMDQSRNRYLKIANGIDKAIVAESARWGDTQASTPYGNTIQQPSPLTNRNHDHYPAAPHAPDIYFTREDSWIVERDQVLDYYIPTLHDESSSFAFVNELRATNLYPDLASPDFSSPGGIAAPGSTLQMSAPEGTIYFTRDGSDPRVPAVGMQTILLDDRAPARALIPSNGTLGLTWTERGFEGDTLWPSGTTGVGYESSAADYAGLIGLNVIGMRNRNGSVYIRVPFAIDGPATLSEIGVLRLNMRYDDGFIAYLNGVKVAEAHAPSGSPAWDSLASTSHSDSVARVFQSFDITPYKGELAVGENVIAIHGLNQTLGSTDLLTTPQLVAFEESDLGIAASAMPYTGGIPLTATGQIKARVLSGGEWSALTEAFFIVGTPASSENLVVSEIMYNPDGPDDAEFIELMNIAGEAIDLTGVRFGAGIDFAFPDGFALDAGERVILTRSRPAFQVAYPGVPVLGEFQNSTALNNGGEQIMILDALNDVLRGFQYDDRVPWPEVADGGGPSLVLIAPEFGPNHDYPGNWRPSVWVGGHPDAGDFEPFANEPLEDADNDRLSAITEYYLGTSDTDPMSGAKAFGAAIETFPNAEPPGDYFVFRSQRNLAADDVVAEVQFSATLQPWSGDSESAILVSSEFNGDGTETVTYRSARPVEIAGTEFVRLKAYLR